jgi:DNA-binding transcriptional MerR regulator
MGDDSTFSMDDLTRLTSYPRRTIRYYVQYGLLDRPIGDGRASHYTNVHLRQLLEIKKLTEYGLSLDAIKNHLKNEAKGFPFPQERIPGAVQVQSRVFLAPGIEVIISPDETDLSPEEIRLLVKTILDSTQKLFANRSLDKSKNTADICLPELNDIQRRAYEILFKDIQSKEQDDKTMVLKLSDNDSVKTDDTPSASDNNSEE